jgi:hypothetical protein
MDIQIYSKQPAKNTKKRAKTGQFMHVLST